MLLKESGIGGQQSTLEELDLAFESVGFTRFAWDYHHSTYDYMITDKGNTYYLRVQGHCQEGKIEDPDAVLKLDEPFIGKHLFPHGMDYDSPMPDQVVSKAKQQLQSLKEKLAQ
ncbi:YugN family protein [Brevibacillus daliensis]|uniref:YugN family protein n=1 Tax=Brevibacillus daliensis TaxID=2892995 RepID=UPI001E365C91|nr:YugN family protein [Brevibacillus daliensis]